MLERFRHNIGSYHTPLLLAVSGGVDSMTMAALFAKVLPSASFAVVNCNFHLRGEESDGDSDFVRQWAEANGVRFFGKDFDTAAYASEKGTSIEMAARELRYRWFSDICTSEGFDAVAVAHNANDNAETLMLNLLRGTGLKGLCGMQDCGTIPVAGSETLLLRPMLPFSRREIEEYARANGVVWREDSSNKAVEYKRNRLRNNLFPEFEIINPSFLETFSRDIRCFSRAQAVLETWAEDLRSKACGKDSYGHLTIDVDALRACGHTEYALYHLLEPYGFNSVVIEGVSRVLGVPGKRFLSDKFVLVSSSSVLTLAPRGGDGAAEESVVVDGSGEYVLGNSHFTVSCKTFSPDMRLKQPRGTLMFDSATLHFPLIVRKWREGDWLCPLGMKGRKKLSDMFVDLKYNAFDKAEALVLAFDAGSRVAALIGERIDDTIKVTPSCENVTIISKL